MTKNLLVLQTQLEQLVGNYWTSWMKLIIGTEGNIMTSREDAKNAVKTLLGYLENNVNREGLLETPTRVIDSWDEIFSGYNMDAKEILSSTFNGEGYDGIVLLKDIEFHSTCEHHLQPFQRKKPRCIHTSRSHCWHIQII